MIVPRKFLLRGKSALSRGGANMSQKIFTSRYYTEKELESAGFRSLGRNIMIHDTINIYGVENIEIGDNVRIDAFVSIIATGFVKIRSYVHIGAYCLLSGGEGIIMEDFSGLSHGVKVYSRSDDYSGRYLTNPTVPKKYAHIQGGTVTLKKHVIVGAGSVILPGVTIGEGSAVGALSLVTKSLPDWGIYFGLPAKRIKTRSRDLLDLEEQLLRETHR